MFKSKKKPFAHVETRAVKVQTRRKKIYRNTLVATVLGVVGMAVLGDKLPGKDNS